jgi:hypothetical protein
MLSAARSSSRAGVSRPRFARRQRWPGILKVSAGALGIVVAAGLVCVAALSGLGWLVAVSPEARNEFRPVVRAAAPESQTWARQTWARQTWASQTWARSVRGEPEVRLAAVVALPTRKEAFRFTMPVVDPLGALARIIPDQSESADDHIVTASIAPYVPRRVTLQIFSRPPELAEVIAPLPRARPKLASLTPLDGITIKPDLDDALRRKTAIYDITAKTVYMPNGERLEAHSGLGEKMDDPRYKHVRMQGVTPPNTYTLSLREALFHGVQALRMTPVDEAAMFGRDGILAHSYLLGPNGQSNGCISFRDYQKFLDAYLRGEVERVVVVERLDKPPVYVNRARTAGAAAVF